MNQEIADAIERIGIKRIAEAAGIAVSKVSAIVSGKSVASEADSIKMVWAVQTCYDVPCHRTDFTTGARVLRITGRNQRKARVTLRPGIRYEGQFLAYQTDIKTGKLVPIKGSRQKLECPTITGMILAARKALAAVA